MLWLSQQFSPLPLFTTCLFRILVPTDLMLLTANSRPGTSASLSCIHYRGTADALRQSRTSQRLLLNPLVCCGTCVNPYYTYPLLSQEREKLRISDLAITFRGFIRTKAH